jgi:hypothetical protein
MREMRESISASSAICLIDFFAHGGMNALLFLDQSLHSIPRQARGQNPFQAGDLLQPGLLLGSEWNFHGQSLAVDGVGVKQRGCGLFSVDTKITADRLSAWRNANSI